MQSWEHMEAQRKAAWWRVRKSVMSAPSDPCQKWRLARWHEWLTCAYIFTTSKLLAALAPTCWLCWWGWIVLNVQRRDRCCTDRVCVDCDRRRHTFRLNRLPPLLSVLHCSPLCSGRAGDKLQKILWKIAKISRLTGNFVPRAQNDNSWDKRGYQSAEWRSSLFLIEVSGASECLASMYWG